MSAKNSANANLKAHLAGLIAPPCQSRFNTETTERIVRSRHDASLCKFLQEVAELWDSCLALLGHLSLIWRVPFLRDLCGKDAPSRLCYSRSNFMAVLSDSKAAQSTMPITELHPEVRVLLIDTTKMTCQLLAQAIGGDEQIKVVGAVTTTSEALKIAKELSPDVALISECLNGEVKAGYQLTEQLQAINNNLVTVMLLDSSNSPAVVEAFRAGASGVFTRDGSLELLRKCILTVVRGQVWASTAELRSVLAAFSRSSTSRLRPEDLEGLTTREREVVQLAANGIRNQEIARQLGISQHTVKNYLFSTFKKLGISSRVELALAFKQSSISGHTGVPQSPARSTNEIIDFLRALAEQGNISAQLLLAEVYCGGHGAPPDLMQAHRLLSLVEASSHLEQASRRTREKVFAAMTPAQAAEAERETAAWLRHNRKPGAQTFPALTGSRIAFRNAKRRQA
jgi:two-component system, NarL family, nitrate/nitrite response regulator NarL